MVINTLWLKVSDEVEIPGRLLESEQQSLAAIFDSRNPLSPWSKALLLLGMSAPQLQAPIIRFEQGTPYFNGTSLALTSSHGTIYPIEKNGTIAYRTRLGFFGFFRVLHAQWQLEKFLSNPNPTGNPLEESIALGLTIQALMLRLPSKGEAELARWLANPTECPQASRSTVLKILAVQRRRNLLSQHWNTLFTPTGRDEPDTRLPAFFWNELSLPTKKATEQALPKSISAADSWKGIPVCPGTVEGQLIWVENNNKINLYSGSGAIILVFARAKPETTELFSGASAVLFAEGGALSHACSIAREQGIPCVSGLGQEFQRTIKQKIAAGAITYALVNGATGEVSLCSEPNT